MTIPLDIEAEARTVQDAVAMLAAYYPVDFATLHLFRSGEDAQNQPYVRTTYPDAWVSHYLLNEYVRIDPVLKVAERIPGPFCWSTIVPEGAQIAMMEQARKHGLGMTGFSVRHVDPIGRRSVLSFNARMAKGDDTWIPYLADKRDELIQLAHQFHHKALGEIYADHDALPQLSPREIECLKWTAQGKAHTDIAIILDLSEHTIRGYLKEARQKLDCVTLAQAVSKAAALGLI